MECFSEKKHITIKILILYFAPKIQNISQSFAKVSKVHVCHFLMLIFDGGIS